MLSHLSVSGPPSLLAAIAGAWSSWRLPTRLSLSEWVEEHCYLSSEDSSEPGRFTPMAFQRGLLDAMGDPDVTEVDVIKGAQVGYTTLLKFAQGYFIAYEPCPQLMIQPTIEMSQTYSKDRLAPMLRDVPVVGELVADSRSRDSGNTILHKRFPGGHLTLAGANSPASLASRPVRLVMFDEVDRYPSSAGNEGDPVSLGIKRTARFWNRKIIHGGTPTIEGKSRTQAREAESDQRRWHVPCPVCGIEQVMRWGAPGVSGGVRWDPGRPETARYECCECGELWDDSERWAASESGRWVATNPKAVAGRVGFHMWEAMYPGAKLEPMVRSFLEARKFPELLQTWLNTTLGECWREKRGARVDAGPIMDRREDYGIDPLPACVCLITMSVDVQMNRLVAEIIGWGPDEESWGLERITILGDPTSSAPWEALDTHRARTFRHPSGANIRISRVGVDSGNWTESVYGYVERRRGQGVVAIKGEGGQGRPLTAPGRAKGRPNCPLLLVGTDTAKDIISHRLAVSDPGPGYWHFPTQYGKDFFSELTAEERDAKGRWTKKVESAANEALDVRVYGIALLSSLSVDLHALFAMVSRGTVSPGRQGRKRGVRGRKHEQLHTG